AHGQLQQLGAGVAIGHALRQQLIKLLARPLGCRYSRGHGDASSCRRCHPATLGFGSKQECIPVSLSSNSRTSPAMLDQCDPATFVAAGICCAVLPHAADVTLQEFLALLFSPLIKTVVGHPAWQFEPSFLDIRPGQTLRVTNNGGEAHTFTEVTNFGGGSIALLNGSVSPPAPAGTVPLTLAPECPATPAGLGPIIVASGATLEVPLSPGEHKFECCIHPMLHPPMDARGDPRGGLAASLGDSPKLSPNAISAGYGRRRRRATTKMSTYQPRGLAPFAHLWW